jgi:hypothetical protein
VAAFGVLQLCLVYISTQPGPFFGGCFPEHDDCVDNDFPNNLFGLAIIQWGLEATPIHGDPFDVVRLRTYARRGMPRGSNVCGYVSWRILEMVLFSGDPSLPPNINLPTFSWLCGQDLGVQAQDGSFTAVANGREWIRTWTRKYQMDFETLINLFLPPQFYPLLVAAEPMQLFHTVPLQRDRFVPVRKFFLDYAPTARIVKAWLASLPDIIADAGAGAIQTKSKWEDGLDVHKCIAFLKASSYLKNIGRTPEARIAFRELEDAIAPDGPLPSREVGADWNTESLRKARVKLDATCMLLTRAFIQSIPTHLTYIFLYVDASPQWRGEELFVTSFDLICRSVSNFCERRLMPQISIGPVMYSAIGKSCGLLHQLFLVAGPSFTRMRRVCDMVVGILSDFGTERLIVYLRDILPEWCTFMGIAVPMCVERRSRLFPNSILSPGWHHVFDGLVRFGLYTFFWFPAWLKVLKLLLTFCRNHGGDLYDFLISKGLDGAAAVFKSIHFVTFAIWRWRKLHLVSKCIRKAWEVFSGNMDVVLEFAKSLKDAEMVKAMRASFDDALFWLRFRFVDLFAARLTTMEQWGSSCYCHWAEWQEGTVVDCPHKGRIVPYAFDMTKKRLRGFAF